MALADLHVHSKYSKHPAQWFLQRIGTKESYTEVEDVYRIAKGRGMNFVTLCDHNSIEGAQKLVELFPEDTFMSVEATAYFPEDDCKIHVLVYDLDERQFQEVDRLRSSIYELRDYLKEENLAHSVAHATYNINGRLNFETLEKLILLFDVFEEINGARNPKYNFTWGQALAHLSPEDIDRLYTKHHIEPFSNDPWIKGLTAGSDDHAGLFIGQTFTEADCISREEFLEHIRLKYTVGGGKSSNFKSLAFAIYKIACEFSQQGKGGTAGGPLHFVNSLIFEDKKPGLRKRLAVKRMKSKGGETNRIVTKFLEGLMNDFLAQNNLSVEKKIDMLYEKIATMSDDFFAMIFESLERDFKTGDLSGLVKNVSAILPAIFLSVPFFSTLKHLSHDRELIERIKTEFIDKYQQSETHVLWFSDTIHNEHEAALTLKKVIQQAGAEKRIVHLLTSTPTGLRSKDLPVKSLNLPYIYSYTPEFSSDYTMYVPSVLKSLEIIYQQNPDKIIISTPGPLGALGLLSAKLLGIPCHAIYHSDFVLKAEDLSEENLLADPIDTYLRWFYSYVDILYAPTQEIVTMLEEQGYERAKLRIFPNVPASAQEDLLQEFFGPGRKETAGPSLPHRPGTAYFEGNTGRTPERRALAGP